MKKILFILLAMTAMLSASAQDNKCVVKLKDGTLVRYSTKDVKEIYWEIDDGRVKEIVLDKTELSLDIDETYTFTPTVLPATALNKELDWTSSNPDVVNVNRNGKVVAWDYGTATITCTAKDGSGVKAECVVTVKRNDEPSVFDDNPQTFTVGGVNFTMIPVQAGTFQMGSTDGYDSEKPVHNVTISKGYYIGETEVTQALWKAVTGYSPTSSGSSWYSHCGIGDDYPAYYISWNDVQEFITKLNDLTGMEFRMPTEAEWEYAARGGNKSQGYTYSGSNIISDVAWYTENSYDKGYGSPDYGTHAVKTKAANELGIYDMTGNVWEWCSDWYSSFYYSSSPSTDPAGPTSGSLRVFRGGSWGDRASSCRTAYRCYSTPSIRLNALGVRLALSSSPSQSVIVISSITITGSKSELEVGETLQLTASVTPSNATNKNLTWSTSDASIATVSSSGLVTALKAGNVTITATANDGSGVKAECTITVKGTPVSSITITGSKSELTVGNTLQLTASVTPSNATNKNLAWSTSDASIATVSSSGLVTALKSGNVTITATANDGSGVKGTYSINIKHDPVDITVNGVTFRMIPVEAGSFLMGSSSGETDAHPHTVTLTYDYYIGETEVTQALWEAVTGYSPTNYATPWSSTYGIGDDYPAYNISYEDVRSFLVKLNSLTARNITFRMPTEAEWEYAARGGHKKEGYTYSGSNTLDDVAWYAENSGRMYHRVKTKAPNGLGIYDMSGNVAEWCSDWYSNSYYRTFDYTDPKGPSSGNERVYRGGGYTAGEQNCRTYYRCKAMPESSFIGVRLVCDPIYK